MSNKVTASDSINDFKELKIIHAGLHRTGSSSLALALEILGFGPVYHGRTFMIKYPKIYEKSWEWWIKNDILKKLNNGNENINFEEWLNIIKC